MREIICLGLMLWAITATAQFEWPPEGTQGVDFNVTDKKGQKQGLWYRTYSTGGLYYVGTFKDGKPEPGTELNYYYDSGELMSIHKFRMDGITVDAQNVHKNGRLQGEGKYVNQLKDSIWNFYSEAGELVLKENYVKDLREGEAFIYYSDGTVERSMTYHEDKLQGPWKEFFPDSGIKSEGNSKDNHYHGEFKSYHPNGTLHSEGQYENGVKSGSWFFYLSSGKMQKQEFYADGRKSREKWYNGEVMEYYDSGIPKLDCIYKDGELHGPFKEFYDQGEWVKEQVMGDEPGSALEWKESLINTQISVEGEYHFGKLDGEITHYNDAGGIEKIDLYDKGVFVETLDE